VQQSLSGGTINLLRMARTECRSSVAFVALADGDETYATAVYPSVAEDDSLGPDQVDDLVRQLWQDPRLREGKALVKTVQLGDLPTQGPARRLGVAAVPLRTDTGDPLGVVGIADPESKVFGMAELQLLSRLSQRLASYVSARQEMRRQLAPGARPPAGPTAGPTAGAGMAAPRQVAPRPPAIVEGHSAPPPAATAGGSAHETAVVADLLGGATEGLVTFAGLIGRTGRLLGASTASGSVVIVALEIVGIGTGVEDVVPELARALRAELRFDDPVARFGTAGFVAVVASAPGAASADAVEHRLASALGAALAAHEGVAVRSTHTVTGLSADRDADELVRTAVRKLRGR